MRRSVFLILVSLMFMGFSGSAGALPETLDDAQPGPASRENPFFTRVLNPPLSDGGWVKLSDVLYEGPSEDVYRYDAATGRIAKLDGVTHIGNRIYGADGRLIGQIYEDRDENGDLIRTRYYGGYEYDDEGNLIGYSRTDYDAEGNIDRRYDYTYDDGRVSERRTTVYDDDGNPSRVYEYGDYTYGPDGRATGYNRTDRDGAGNILRRYAYEDITYHTNGRTESYTRHDYDAGGTLLRDQGYTFDDAGRVTERLQTNYDGEGNVTGSNGYSGYSYDEDNRVIQYDRTDRDASGALIRSYEYRDYDYHENGRTASYERTERDASGAVASHVDYTYNTDGLLSEQTQTVYDGGVPDRGYRYSDYAYNDDRRHTSFRLDYLDASGAVTQTLLRSLEEYNGDGRLSSYSDRRYDNGGGFVSWYDYANRTYDASGQVMSYNWTRRDDSGNVIGSGTWNR